MKYVRWSFNGKGKSKTLFLPNEWIIVIKSDRVSFYPETVRRWYLYIIKKDFRDELLKLRIH